MLSIKPGQRYADVFFVLTLLIIFGFSSLLFLDRFPKTWMDEAWDSTTAYTFQLDWTFRNTSLVDPAFGNQDVHFLQPRIFSNVVMAPFFAWLGVGNFQGRLASVFVGALAVVGIYLLARKAGGPIFAAVCALLLIFDNLFFVVTRTIRPEIYVTTISIWALYFILGGENSFWKLFTGGVLLGISLYTHPNSFLVLIAVFIAALSQVKIKQYGKILFPVTLGVILGFLPYAYYVWDQDGANQFRDFWLQIQHRAEMLKDPGAFFSGALTAELERYGSYIFFPYRLLIFLIQFLAIGYAFYKWTDGLNRAMLIFIFVHVLLFPILISAKTSRYLTVLMPVVIILVVRMVWEMAGWPYDINLSGMSASIMKLNRSVLIPVALILILFANQVGGDVWAVWKSRDCSFAPFISQLRLLIPSDAKVWGPMTFWFGFYDHPYRTQWTVNTEEEMNDFQPEYVILYDNVEIWANQTGVTKRLDPNYERMEAIRNLLVQLAKSRGVVAGSVPNSCYGNIEVFKLTWK
ncbi:glycosyltransferase family 39 protein [Candidatus Villigracilis affinis]|uniref:ArnT family glycosyltransferase n=1 Tax=Candidatus Villigracilis affinis TaxID=3140682 RepID=UPI002A2333EF|nr:glycosyltransferase family 39 protein [Anaerolineales bacterium]